MSKHTAGPWCPDDAQPGDLFRYVVHGEGDSFGWICQLSTNGNANAEADARLIAAAPLLLEALQSLHTAVDSGRIFQQVAAMEVAAKAIAKATRETP